MDRRTFCLALSALAAQTLVFSSRAVAANPWPSRPVRVISPYAAGGGPDVQLRQAGPALGDALGQPVVIENKVGAGGVLAAQYASQSPADGYTLLMGSNTHLIQKLLQPSLRFDPVADFAPACNLVSSPTVLVVSAQAPWRTIDELIADLKTRPGMGNYGSGGVGTSAHLAGATLAALAGLKTTHIPLKGSVEIAASLMRGDTQFAFPVAGTAIPQIKGGRLRALAVTSRERMKLLPDVPTLQETLRSDLAVQESWFGIWAPHGTPADIVSKVHAAVFRAASTPAVVTAFEAAGTLATPSASPQAFADLVKRDQAKWAGIIKLTGVAAG